MKSPKKSKQPATHASASEEEPYEPTPIEREALEAFKRGDAKRPPRLKVTNSTICDAKIEIDHPHLAYGQLSLMKGIGTTNSDFLEGLILGFVRGH